jgi:hypothetical protein
MDNVSVGCNYGNCHNVGPSIGNKIQFSAGPTFFPVYLHPFSDTSRSPSVARSKPLPAPPSPIPPQPPPHVPPSQPSLPLAFLNPDWTVSDSNLPPPIRSTFPFLDWTWIDLLRLGRWPHTRAALGRDFPRDGGAATLSVSAVGTEREWGRKLLEMKEREFNIYLFLMGGI